VPGERTELPPRLRGLVILVGSASMVALNLFASRYAHTHYRALFPFAGFFFPWGLFTLIHAPTTDDIRSGKVPRPIVLSVFLASGVGLAFGVWANHALFGRWL
jgi:hypothetical protein